MQIKEEFSEEAKESAENIFEIKLTGIVDSQEAELTIYVKESLHNLWK